MKRGLSLFMILLLIFGTGIELNTYGSEVFDEKVNNIQIHLGENTNKDKAILKLATENDGLNEIELILPKNSSYNGTETTKSNDENLNFQYKNKEHSLIISWANYQSIVKADIVLENITNDTIFILSKGIYNDSSTKLKKHSFVIEDREKRESQTDNGNHRN